MRFGSRLARAAAVDRLVRAGQRPLALFDPESGGLYEQLSDRWMRNYGLLGGRLHVRLVRNAAPSRAQLLGDQLRVRSTDPFAVDGRRMGDRQYARCIEVSLMPSEPMDGGQDAHLQGLWWPRWLAGRRKVARL